MIRDLKLQRSISWRQIKSERLKVQDGVNVERNPLVLIKEFWCRMCSWF